jgi:hypothetical protein
MERRSFLRTSLAATMAASTRQPQARGAPKAAAGGALKLHPSNPHYFLFRGRPTILITAGEHYGAVLNLDFDTLRYLDALRACGFNLTRTFSGAYREVAGSFRITGNTLAPRAGRYLCPWARSTVSGAADGGNKFDLTRWDPAYFRRLKEFVRHAGKRGIVVEMVLFCTMYDEALWNASPMNAGNNINGIGGVGRHEVYSGRDGDLLAVQQAVTRKIVAELNGFDNVYFEVCNEPYKRPGLSPEWNDQIIAAIVAEEADRPMRHLIAQNVGHGAVATTDLNPHVSILNFHAASADAVRLNHALNKVCADDETGGADRSDRKYRVEGWEFILAGGGVYDHLDFSFTTEHADGTAVPLPPGTPGGGGPELRRQLTILKEFIEGFDFVRMAPHQVTVKSGKPEGAETSSPPSEAEIAAHALAQPGEAYAVYLRGGSHAELALDLPAGSYKAEWVSTKTGRVEKTEAFRHAGGTKSLASPVYSEDIALRVRR